MCCNISNIKKLRIIHRFQDDDDEEYVLSGSDDEYTQGEKELLKKVQSRRKSVSDSEVTLIP